MPAESDGEGGGFSHIYFQLRHEQKLMIRCEIFRLIGKQSREIDCSRVFGNPGKTLALVYEILHPRMPREVPNI